MLKHKIFFNSSEDMSNIYSSNVSMMITSPPYWNLKDYETDNQIGYKEDYETYCSRITKVWSETFLSLKDDGVAIININTKSFNKKVYLIPYDIIKQMKSIGFYLKDVSYWHKSSGIPRKNNFGDHFEYFLIFSKSNKHQLNDFNFFDYKLNFEHPSNIWNINKRFGSLRKKYMVHPAIFPVKYIERMIEIFTKPGDIILDPFLGSGTSLIAANNKNRSCYGFELNKNGYLPIILDRMKEEQVSKDSVSFH